MEEKSLENLMSECFSLSLLLTYKSIAPNDHFLEPSDFNYGQYNDLISSWSDGLFHKYYERMSTGECSIQSMIDFDIEKFEQDVINTIDIFCALLWIYGFPKQLTYEDMQKMGYRGAWAGYTKEQDIKYYINLFEEDLIKLDKELKDYHKLPKKKKNPDIEYSIISNINRTKQIIEEYKEQLNVLHRT